MGHDGLKVMGSVIRHFFSCFFRVRKNDSIRNGSSESPFSQVVEPFFSNYENLKRQGTEMLDLGKVEQAILFFETALQEYPGSESHLNLGFALFEGRRVNEAKFHLERAADLSPNNFDAHLLCAVVADSENNHDIAFKSIRLALNINPDSGVAKGLLFKLFATRREFKEIENYVRLSNKKLQTPAEFHMAVALIYMSMTPEADLKATLLNTAKEHLEIAIALDPTDPVALTQHGNLLLLQKDTTLAARSFQKAITVNCFFAPALYGLAIFYQTCGNDVEALKSAESAVQADSKYIDAYKLLGEICLKKTEYLKAEIYYKKIIEIDPSLPDSFLMLGTIYNAKGEHKKGIDVTRKALSLRKNSPEVYFVLGNVLAGEHLFSEAVECYHHALRLRPGYADVRNNLASTLLSMGENSQALIMYQSIVADDPLHLTGLQNIAFCLSFDAACTPLEYLVNACKFGAAATAKAKPFSTWRQQPLADRPLKVGLVSGDLRRHPVGFFLESVLKYFDIEKIEIHAF